MDENNVPLGGESQDGSMTPPPTDAGVAPTEDEATAEKMPDSAEGVADGATEGEAPAM